MNAIIITIPMRFFNEHPGGEKHFRDYMEEMNTQEGHLWYNTISNAPKAKNIIHCYILFDGKIQYRANIANIEKNVTKTFPRGNDIVTGEILEPKTFKNKTWLWLTAPIVKAPFEIKRKGFQGFRYTEYLF